MSRFERAKATLASTAASEVASVVASDGQPPKRAALTQTSSGRVGGGPGAGLPIDEASNESVKADRRDVPPQGRSTPNSKGQLLNTALQVGAAAGGNIAGGAAAAAGASTSTASEAAKGAGRAMAKDTVKSGARSVSKDVATEALTKKTPPAASNGAQEPSETRDSWSDLRRAIRGATKTAVSGDTGQTARWDDGRSRATKARDRLKDEAGIDADAAVGAALGGAASAAMVASGVGAAAAGVVGSAASSLGTQMSRASHTFSTTVRSKGKRAAVYVAGAVAMFILFFAAPGDVTLSSASTEQDQVLAALAIQQQAANSASAVCPVSQKRLTVEDLGLDRRLLVGRIQQASDAAGAPVAASVIATMSLLVELSDNPDAVSTFDPELEVRNILGVAGWQAMTLDAVASEVNGEAIPGRYAPYEAAARAMLTQLGAPAGTGCVPPGLPLACAPVASEQAYPEATSDALSLVRCLSSLMMVQSFTISAEGTLIRIPVAGDLVDVDGSTSRLVTPDAATPDGSSDYLVSWLITTASTFGVDYIDLGARRIDVLPATPSSGDEGEKAVSVGSLTDALPAGVMKIKVFGTAGTGLMPSAGGWVMPVPAACASSEFNPHRVHPVTHKVRPHNGIDLPMPSGTPIVAANAGTVTRASYDYSGGNTVILDNAGGIETLYMHMIAFAVSKGDHVSSGQVIGYVGTTGESTGNHLHLGVRRSGAFENPRTFFSSVGVTLPGRCG